MRVLSRPKTLVVAVLVVASMVNTTEVLAGGRTPEHGFSPGEFYPLWSGDVDGNLSANATDGLVTLAEGTDIPFGSPPVDVERWNRLDLGDFPATNSTVALHPPGANLTESALIKDASISIFAVQPSTVPELAPGKRPLLVTRNGSVLGVVDYRVAPPSDAWRLTKAQIKDVELLVDGVPEASTNGTRTPVLDYTGLDGVSGTQHRLTFRARISVVLKSTGTKTVTSCTRVRVLTNPLSTTDSRWTWVESCTTTHVQTQKTKTDEVIVTDSRRVVVYALGVNGTQATYPNGDRGYRLTANESWAGYSTASGRVQGTTAFYSARNPAWDTLIESTPNGSETIASPLTPLQVFAYPRASGPTSSGSITLLDATGPVHDPPTLPAHVLLDVPNTTYVESTTLVTQIRPGDTTITAHGLVRGSDITVSPRELETASVHETNLTLDVEQTTPENVTIRLSLRDNASGMPIDTRQSGGTLTLGSEVVSTNASGTVTRTLPRTTSVITAHYTPVDWWVGTPAYMPSSDLVYVRGTPLDLLGALYGIGVPVGLLLLAGFIIDRATGANLWPPWRNL